MISSSTHKVPVIGISCKRADSHSVVAMAAQVRANGGIPRILTKHAQRDPAKDIDQLDGLFVMGNDYDVFPEEYIHRYPAGDPRGKIHKETNNHVMEEKTPESDQEARDRAAYQKKLFTLARAHNMPTLEVCGGMQEDWVANGGGILQHVPDLVGSNHHMQSTDNLSPFCAVTPITIVGGSNLAHTTGKHRSLYRPGPFNKKDNLEFMDNSYHHQAIDPDMPAKGFRIVAWSDEFTNYNGEKRRMPEAIEPDPNGPFKDWKMLGTQWHPEFGASPISASIISTWVHHAAEYAKHSPRDRSQDEAKAMISNLTARPKTDQTYVDQLTATIDNHSFYRA